METAGTLRTSLAAFLIAISFTLGHAPQTMTTVPTSIEAVANIGGTK